MKKTLVISLLAVLLYNSVGFVVSFQVLRFEWKQQVRLFLANSGGKNDFKAFHFHKNDVNAHENEFEIEGQFYDVFEKTIVGDSVVLKCFADEKETELVSEFHSDIQKNISQKADFQHKSDSFFSFLIKDYIFDTPFTLSAHPSVYETLGNQSSYINPIISTPIIAGLTPPPRLESNNA